MQNTIEAYYRLQVTGALQVTFDVQALVPPAGSVGDESAVAGAIRAKWTF
jgi:carbohydrate-selective porin OprB